MAIAQSLSAFLALSIIVTAQAPFQSGLQVHQWPNWPECLVHGFCEPIPRRFHFAKIRGAGRKAWNPEPHDFESSCVRFISLHSSRSKALLWSLPNIGTPSLWTKTPSTESRSMNWQFSMEPSFFNRLPSPSSDEMAYSLLHWKLRCRSSSKMCHSPNSSHWNRWRLMVHCNRLTSPSWLDWSRVWNAWVLLVVISLHCLLAFWRSFRIWKGWIWQRIDSKTSIWKSLLECKGCVATLGRQ